MNPGVSCGKISTFTLIKRIIIIMFSFIADTESRDENGCVRK